ncbi:glycerol kinase [bacterium]|nr:glycerol kinase [bacterium]
MKYILSIDVGTSNVRVMLINSLGEMVAISQKNLVTLHPYHGHTEMNPEKIISCTMDCVENALMKISATKQDILGIGISNARETTILWDKTTGKPLWNAILWNDVRSKDFCTKHQDKEEMIRKKTGLFLTSYGSATKIRWILNHGNIEKVENCLFGNINTYLLWKLTEGEVFATDATNAARTLLYNINTGEWDEELLNFFEIPTSILPKVKSNCEVYGYTSTQFFGAKIPICSMIGDAQSALFAAGCHEEGEAHLSLGTGGFLLKSTGKTRSYPKSPLATTIALQMKDGSPSYCEEGSVLSIGSVVEWLKTHMGIIRSAKEIEGLAYSVPDSFGVYFVPTIHGGGKKDGENMRGSFLGLSSSSNIGHICRAVLEGISFMLFDLFQSMKKESETKKLKCSGGVSENIFLMQMIANLLNVEIARSSNIELSAYGAAYLTGICLGVWKDKKEITSLFSCDREFTPSISKEDKDKMLANWKKAFSSTRSFSD